MSNPPQRLCPNLLWTRCALSRSGSCSLSCHSRLLYCLTLDFRPLQRWQPSLEDRLRQKTGLLHLTQEVRGTTRRTAWFWASAPTLWMSNAQRVISGIIVPLCVACSGLLCQPTKGQTPTENVPSERCSTQSFPNWDEWETIPINTCV